MTMHLLRRASASNSDMFGTRYEIRKLRGTFPIVILVEQADASNIPLCDRARKSAESPRPT